MFVVTVLFQIKPDHIHTFAEAIQANAQYSLDKEPECHRFDVCKDPEDSNSIFLYEVYESRAAFGLHLESAHFKTFDALVADWVESKAVKAWDLEYQAK
ncbi:MAG: antibiotic biosynthesis monooxygenase [Rhodospirillales bacterium]|nr:antibiotic biosynthesis monooxygenase [Rhodospirillales bacterium]